MTGTIGLAFFAVALTAHSQGFDPTAAAQSPQSEYEYFDDMTRLEMNDLIAKLGDPLSSALARESKNNLEQGIQQEYDDVNARMEKRKRDISYQECASEAYYLLNKKSRNSNINDKAKDIGLYYVEKFNSDSPDKDIRLGFWSWVSTWQTTKPTVPEFIASCPEDGNGWRNP